MDIVAEMEKCQVTDDGRIIHSEWGDITADVVSEINFIEAVQHYDAEKEQAKIHKFEKQVERRNGEMGTVVARINVQDYDEQEKLEPGCWKSDWFIKDFLRHAPEFKTKVAERAPVITPGKIIKP